MGVDEIELKFLCEPSDVAALLAAAPVGVAETKHLVATYFDTPQGHLREAHISLRLRDSNGKVTQTLKRGDGFAREEHEARITGEALDLTMPALKAALKPAQRQALVPVFTVSVVRQQRTFDFGGARIELALDQGEIAAGDLRSGLCELELELKAGDPRALFALARELCATAPLYLSFDGKATQGQGLLAGTQRAPRHHDKAPLRRGGTAAEAFQTIARNALVQITANGLVLREADGEAALHQLRVALRRLRSGLGVFSTMLDDRQRRHLDSELKWLSRACNEARDLDVFHRENLKLVGADAPLTSQVEAARAQAHAKAASAVASRRFRDLVLETTAWVETGDWRDRVSKGGGGSARDFATKALGRLWRKHLKRGADLMDMDDAGRHRVRIGLKRLRYAAEAFAPLFAEPARSRFLKRVKALQDILGQLNDDAVAAGLVTQLVAADAPAARDLMAPREARRLPTLRAANKTMDRLAAAKPFW